MAALAALLDLVFPRRLRRISHILRFVLCNALLVWLLLDASAGDHVSALLFFVVLLYFILFRLLPRARDAGLPGWVVLFYLVPALNIILVYALFFSRTALRAAPLEADAAAESPLQT